MASYDDIRDASLHGKRPLWRLLIHPVSGRVEINFEPELVFFREHRRSIDELASALAMHLHGLTQTRKVP